jgi:hypothetical protein
MIDLLEAIKRVCNETHVPMAQEVFGGDGVNAIFQIMETAQALFRLVELERVKGEIVIYRLVRTEATPKAWPVEVAADFASLANAPIDALAFEIGPDGRPYQRSPGGLSVDELATQGVVYRYAAGTDTFYAGSKMRTVPRIDAVARSQFAVPTFSTLRDALQNYASENVRESTCYIFKEVWSDDKRLFFRGGPEDTMRNSLTQFLRNRLGGDHDVWPEQTVDESHPVDIRVKPRLANNRLMLIEIKWVGWSAAQDGHITARHGQPRAQFGANQLAQYLDDQRRFAPTDVVQGYYVIIDGRRKDLKKGATSISRENGMHFETNDLEFNPNHSVQRDDFDPVYRMFARPICS